MTAQLTTPSGMLPTSGDALTKYRAQERRRGVNLGFGPVPAGQLWERVAEREPEMTVRIAQSLADSDARTLDGDTIVGRGPRLGGGYTTDHARQSCNTYRMCASGVIRAGERIK